MTLIRRTVIFVLILLAIIAIFVCLDIFQQPIYVALDAVDLIPHYETFTELYFDNSSNLPADTTKGVPASFTFTIHNLEGTQFSYPYVVYFQYPDGYRVDIDSGRVTLADNVSDTIRVTHTFLATGEKGTMVVKLTSIDQSIDFIVPDTNG